MKKTLIALAVAASAVVSGSAMAWTANGTGNSVELGGTLTPVAKVTPWEVKTGDAVTNLDADVQKGQRVVEVVVNKAIPVLGIRNASVAGFQGAKSIKPQINYDNAVDVNGFEQGTTTITLPVKNVSEAVIGTMTAPFSAAAVVSWSGVNGSASKAVYAAQNTDSFYGGLGKNYNAIRGEGSVELINGLSSDFIAKWKQQGNWVGYGGTELFEDTSALYFGAYGAGIEQGKRITITLDQTVTGDTQIQWKASLPVTVTYM